MAIAENTTHIVGRDGVVDYGSSIKARWIDLINSVTEKKPEPKVEDNRSAEEFAADMWSRIKG